MKQYPLITVVGGSGFVGRHLIKQLAKTGYRIRVLCRDTVAAEYLKTAGNVGQITPQYADLTKPETLAGKFDGSWAVINLVSILHESGRQKFGRINVEGAKLVAGHARAAGAERFIHVSALGVDVASDSRYASTKKTGEDAVREAFPGVTILRPSLIIGPEDRFFQRFARMAFLAPALPLIGGGHTKFQPTLVTDVASAIMAALGTTASMGQTYALGGPEVLSFKEMLERMRTVINRHFLLLPLPTGIASLMGRVCTLLPFPPMITADQVKLLSYDNVVPAGHAGYESLGITPGSVTAALPSLLSRFIKE